MKLYIPQQFKDFSAIEGVEIVLYEKGADFKEADMIVGNPRDVFANPSAYPKLKFIQLQSSGYDSIPLAELAKAGITVANARGLYSVPMAEYCVGHVLAHYKRLESYRLSQAQKRWTRFENGLTLEGKSVLLLGTGSIAYETALRFRVFGMQVDGVNSNGRLLDGFDHCYVMADVESIVGSYDIVISSLPSNKATYHRLNEGFFAAMKHDSVFVNVGRGDVVDEISLFKALDGLSCAILDVFEEEPLNGDSALWEHPKVVITPHISTSSDRSLEKSLAFFHHNVNAYVSGMVVDNLLTEL